MTRPRLTLALIIPLVLLGGIALGPAQTDAANAALTRNVDNPDRLAIVRQNIRLTLSEGHNDTNNWFSPVPAGKRWVIERVSVHLTIPAGQVPYFRLIVGGDIVQWIPLQPQDDGSYLANLPVEVRVGPHESFGAAFGRNSLTGSASAYLYVTGYEIDYP